MSKLIELYTTMLESLACKVDDRGFVSTLTPGSEKSMPMMIGGKRLVLPFKEQMEITDWSKRIGFHPMLQNFSAGESPVMDALRNRANRFFSFVTGTLFMDLAKLAADKEKHISLTPEQAKYVGPFSDADDKFATNIMSLVVGDDKVRRGNEFIRFTTVMGREWQGQKRNRVSVCTFPLYEKLDQNDKSTTIANIKFTGKQVRMLRAMYKFLFPHIDEQGYYEVGSDSKISPSIESLYGLLDIIIQNINGHVIDLMDTIPSGPFLLIPNEWSEQLKNINELTREIRSIPPLEGNAGRERDGKSASAPTLITEAPKKSARTTDVATVSKADTAAPIVNSNFIEEVNQVQNQNQPEDNNPFRFRLGDAPANNFVDQRTQLPDEVNVVVPRNTANININAFEPTQQYGQFAHERQARERQAQMQKQQQMQMVQQSQASTQVQRIPESAVLIGGVMYIPLEIVGTGQPPQGSIYHEGRLYVPYGQPAQPQRSAFGRSNFAQQNISDPAQVPGLSESEIAFYRQNPAIFQTFLAGRQNQSMNRAAQMQNDRLSEIPPYLQRLQRAQEQAEMQSSPFRRR